MPTKDLMSTQEAAKLLGVSVRTVQLWVESGALGAWKTAGGHRRISRKDVETLVAQQQQVSGRESPNDQFRLLVVDDDADLLKLYRLQIEGWGLPLTLVTAASGFEGLIRVGELRPQLLVTDLNMPGMDGFRMIRMLATNPEFKSMEIIAVTALGKEEVADRGGLPQEVRVFTKPVPFSELERLVRMKLGAT